MQTAFENVRFNPAPAISFIRGRDYMMRSEKRGGSGPAHRSPTPGGKPPRKRRRAGFFYKCLTLFLLLVLWPVGLVLLWQRKLRWGAATKLLTSVVTLAACVVLIGFALTVNTGNPTYTKMQDDVNGFLDSAADGVIAASDVFMEKAEIVYDRASEFGGALWQHSRGYIADGIDWVLDKTRPVRAQLSSILFEESITPVATPDGETPSPLAASAAPTKATVEATNAPFVQIAVLSDDETLPVYIPDEAPSAADGMPITEGMLDRSGVLTETQLPQLNTPEPTPAPTPEPITMEVKPAGEAIVYYNPTGKLYHNVSACRSMKSAAEHTLSEVERHTPCDACTPPDKSILGAKYIVWTDADNTAHLTDECSAFTGMWNIITAGEANEQGLTACAVCGADKYLKHIAAEGEVTVIAPGEATAEPTPEPTEKPTAEPTKAPTAKPSATAKASAKPSAEATQAA